MQVCPKLQRTLFFLLLNHENIHICSNIATRKAEKQEEERARERILQKLEADKVFGISMSMTYFLFFYAYKTKKFVLNFYAWERMVD